MLSESNPPVSAVDKPWNSATTLCIARKIQELASGKRLSILDLGCGNGTILDLIKDYGHELHGTDFPYRGEELKTRLGKHFGDRFDEHIRFLPDERTIPFPDDSFDIVYANQVFEHVKFLDAVLGECARVLKSGGTLIALFPLATYPVELHLKIPFAHWLPPGRIRRLYFTIIYGLMLRRRIPGLSARQTAEKQDQFLKEETFYRFLNEIEGISLSHFDDFSVDTISWLTAKHDLAKASKSILKRFATWFLRPFNGRRTAYLITHLFGGVFLIRNPKKAREHDNLLERGKRWEGFNVYKHPEQNRP